MRSAIIFLTGLLLFFSPVWFDFSHLRPFATPKTLLIYFFSEVIFLLWAILAIRSRGYRPKKSALLALLGVFVSWLTLVSIFGIDFNSSFWSSLDRGIGLVTFLHLFALTLSLVSIIRKEDVLVLMRFAAWGGFFAALTIIFGPTGLKLYSEILGFSIYGDGGFLGNSTLASIYFAFTLPWTIYLAWVDPRKTWKIVYGLFVLVTLTTPLYLDYEFLRGVASFSPTVFLGEARAGTFALFLSFALAVSLYFFFKTGWKKYLGSVLLAVQVAAFLFVGVSLASPDSYIYKKFEEYAGKERFIFWQEAGKAIRERPLLGYGQDNFFFIFQKNLPPKIYEIKYNSEVLYADHPHNNLYEYAVNSGIPGLALYLSIYVYAGYFLIKNYWQKKLTGPYSLALGLPLYASFLQGLFAFDVSFTLLPLFITLGIVSGTTTETRLFNNLREIKSPVVFGTALIIFSALYFFVILPIGETSRAYEKIRTIPVPLRAQHYQTIRGSSIDSVFDLTVFGQKFYKSYEAYFSVERPKEEKEVAKGDINLFVELMKSKIQGKESYTINTWDVIRAFENLVAKLTQ